ncbi:SAM-dependent methyltransferase [Thermopolyspora sp. NPDC052614]|uniref:SAM-dependent methyltransferase n=1 Tax=Thermopolyspora sp. NPDC052614 TaxID=3155682 RepID=UPI0034266AD9
MAKSASETPGTVPNGPTPEAAETPPAPDIDISKPHVARMYDYFLGGKNNYAADREAAEQVIAMFPQTRLGARANRRFLIDAVRWLAGEAGIRQFIDIGSGLPTQQNVHEVAQEIAADARVVYVDNDPLVRVHADALLAANGNTAVIEADLRDPQAILNDATLRGHLDLSRPVGLLMVAVLHFIEDFDTALASVRHLCDGLPSGSYLVISHGLAQEGRDDVEEVRKVYRRSNSLVVMRSRAEIARFFDGLTMVGPGLAHFADWSIGDAAARRRAYPDDRLVSIDDRSHLADIPMMGGIGRIDR